MTDIQKRLSDVEDDMRVAVTDAITRARQQNWKNGGVLLYDADELIESLLRDIKRLSASAPEHATRQGMTEEKARETPSPLTPRGIADRQIWTFAYDVAFRFRADFSHPGREFFKRAKTIGILIESLVGTDEARDGLESAHGWKQDHPDDHADDPRAMEEISQPNEPGGFIGDIWFGHSQKRNLGTHRWDGEKWKVLPDEIDSLLVLLAKARARIDELSATSHPSSGGSAGAFLKLNEYRMANLVDALSQVPNNGDWWGETLNTISDGMKTLRIDMLRSNSGRTFTQEQIESRNIRALPIAPQEVGEEMVEAACAAAWDSEMELVSKEAMRAALQAALSLKEKKNG